MDDLTIARRFALAINGLESDGDVEPIVALYAEQSRCGNALHPDAFTGTDGARQFWSQYRGQFTSVHSTFRQIVDSSTGAALEWDTSGQVAGATVDYSGVTMLEFDDRAITRSCAYFDPAALKARADAAASAPSTEGHAPSVDPATVEPVQSVTDGEDG